ncbi:hypothetical protein ACFLWW_01355 [Chloroflexota bacterium]
MRLKYFFKRYWFLVLAAILVIIGSYFSSEAIKWGSYAIGFAVISIGLGISSVNLELQTSKEMKKMGETLSRIEDLQKEIQQEQNGQKGSSTHIIPTLQAFSQFYLDYLNKQKEEDKK